MLIGNKKLAGNRYIHTKLLTLKHLSVSPNLVNKEKTSKKLVKIFSKSGQKGKISQKLVILTNF